MGIMTRLLVGKLMGGGRNGGAVGGVGAKKDGRGGGGIQSVRRKCEFGVGGLYCSAAAEDTTFPIGSTRTSCIWSQTNG